MATGALGDVVARILGEGEDTQLVSLTREELRAVGDDAILANAADTLWWDGLSEREQELVLETAQRSLVARNLLVPDDDGEIVAVDAVVAVLAARRAFDWAVVLGEPDGERDSDGAPLQVALMALPTQGDGGSAVLVSARVEGVYLHRLLVREASYAVAADWLLRPGDGPTETVGRTVEVLAPREGTLRSSRLLVIGRGGSWRVSAVADEEPGEPETTDVGALAQQLATLTTGLA